MGNTPVVLDGIWRQCSSSVVVSDGVETPRQTNRSDASPRLSTQSNSGASGGSSMFSALSTAPAALGRSLSHVDEAALMSRGRLRAAIVSPRPITPPLARNSVLSCQSWGETDDEYCASVEAKLARERQRWAEQLSTPRCDANDVAFPKPRRSCWDDMMCDIDTDPSLSAKNAQTETGRSRGSSRLSCRCEAEARHDDTPTRSSQGRPRASLSWLSKPDDTQQEAEEEDSTPLDLSWLGDFSDAKADSPKPKPQQKRQTKRKQPKATYDLTSRGSDAAAAEKGLEAFPKEGVCKPAAQQFQDRGLNVEMQLGQSEQAAAMAEDSGSNSDGLADADPLVMSKKPVRAKSVRGHPIGMGKSRQLTDTPGRSRSSSPASPIFSPDAWTEAKQWQGWPVAATTERSAHVCARASLDSKRTERSSSATMTSILSSSSSSSSCSTRRTPSRSASTSSRHGCRNAEADGCATATADVQQAANTSGHIAAGFALQDLQTQTRTTGQAVGSHSGRASQSPGSKCAAERHVKRFLDSIRQQRGAVLRAWQLDFDPHRSGRATRPQFAAACRNLGFANEVRSLWAASRPDGNTEPLNFHEVSSEEAASVDQFVERLVEKVGRPYLGKSWELLDIGRRGFANLADFLRVARMVGFDGSAQLLFRGLDARGHGQLRRDDLGYLAVLSPQPCCMLATQNSTSSAHQEYIAFAPRGGPRAKALRRTRSSIQSAPERQRPSIGNCGNDDARTPPASSRDSRPCGGQRVSHTRVACARSCSVACTGGQVSRSHTDVRI